MRKVLFLILALVPVIVMAQFKVTEYGFKAKDGNGYIVKEYPNQSQHDLFQKVLVNLNNIYKGKDNITSVQDENIVVDAIETLPLANYNYAVSYKLSFFFKDGKIKMDAPSIKRMLGRNGNGLHLMGFSKENGDDAGKFIYKKGELKKEKAKNALELFFNAVEIAALEANTNNKDW